MQIQQWQQWLEAIDINKIQLGLERVGAVLEDLKLDEYLQSCTKILIAGTNGKGSCASTVAYALNRAGAVTGLYTSPHLHLFNERVKVGSRLATDDELCAAFALVKEHSERLDIPLTYFEFATLAALLVFHANRCRCLVMEVGLGGRLDAVNVLKADYAVIASVGFDHMHLLGETIQKIAFEKAGIIKEGCKVIAGPLDDEAYAVIKDAALRCKVPLHAQGREQGFEIWTDEDCHAGSSQEGVADCTEHGMSPALNFKFEDRTLYHLFYKIPKPCVGASLACLSLLERDLKLSLSDDLLQEALLKAALPGRFAKFSFHGSTVIVDVAHNVPAALNLKEQVADEFGASKPALVIGMLKDKDIEGVLRVLSGAFCDFYVCPLPTARGEHSGRLAMGLEACQVPKALIKSYNTLKEALLAACALHAQVVVMGSFVTAALALDVLKE